MSENKTLRVSIQGISSQKEKKIVEKVQPDQGKHKFYSPLQANSSQMQKLVGKVENASQVAGDTP